LYVRSTSAVDTSERSGTQSARFAPREESLVFIELGVVPIPMTAQSKGWVSARWLAGIAGSNPAEGMDVCLVRVLCVSRRGLFFRLITRPEESYQV
jgi:hypothetical protein